MADIVSRLPTQDQSDGATGSAIPTEAILVGGSDGTNLRAISTNSSGAVNILPPADVMSTGTMAALNATVSATSVGGDGTWTVYLMAGGTGWTANTTVLFELSIDGTNFFQVYGVQLNSATGTPNNGTTGPSAAAFQGSLPGGSIFRTRISAYTTPDSVTATIRLSVGNGVVGVRTSLPAGTNSIGAVTQGTSPWVDNITQFGGSAISTGTGNSGAGIPRVTVSNDSSITNISGTISLPTGAATSANQTNASQKTQIVDGSGNVIASQSNQLETVDILNVSTQYRAQSVTTTAAEALGGATILANRKMIHITPTNGIIYWAYNSSVTTTTGTPIFPNNTLMLAVGSSNHVYLIAGATTDSRIAELS